MTTHRLCNIHEIEEETSKEFVVPNEGDGQSVFAVKKDGVISVFANICPHLGIPLNIQPDGFLDMEKNFVICSTHGALFKLDDGECVHGPCLGQNLTPIAHEIIGEDLFVSKGL